ncbi:hypothetical protein CI15_06410 [Paraburkholderia monticola]|uniref:Uncharacterized protein n=1 Tax=Paraburkholderia monticola TaxID=1399968 RepID=A0A149PYM9_9BURK|nr:hypothetical protein [Paraburkholderia monticola]KXU90165.1 hypothetical protein CI15_06410 [Paraburkholderia monticola]
MTRPHVVPEDFPRESSPGLVSGRQPKLLVRETNGRYYAGITDEELWIRYDACEDLAGQLADYGLRKMSGSGLSFDAALGRVEKGLRARVASGQWDFSRDEVAWMMKRAGELLSGTVNSDRARNAGV